jgi:hypothetical protein
MLSQNNKMKMQQQQKQKNPSGLNRKNTQYEPNDSSRRSIRPSQFRKGRMLEDQSMNGQEEDSTQISNNIDRSLNGHRYEGQGVYSDNQNIPCSPQMSVRVPKWFVHFEKQYVFFPLKLRSFTYGIQIPLKEVERIMNREYLLQNFWSIQDEERKKKVLTFVVIRNIVKLQIFVRAILKMRSDAATRIKRKIRFAQEQRELYLNKNQILDQLRYKSCIRII